MKYHWVQVFNAAWHTLTKPETTWTFVVIVALIYGLSYDAHYILCVILLDVMTMSAALRDVIRSVTVPGTTLCLLFLLYMISLTIGTVFGYTHFPEEIAETKLVNGTWVGACSSLMSCWLTITEAGIMSAGDLTGVMSSSTSPVRYFFDQLFYGQCRGGPWGDFSVARRPQAAVWD